MNKKNENRRSTEVLSVRVHPWPLYKLRGYAKVFNYSMITTIDLAISCLTDEVPKKIMDRWLREFKKKRRKNGLD